MDNRSIVSMKAEIKKLKKYTCRRELHNDERVMI
jgi:hypothetical protein